MNKKKFISFIMAFVFVLGAALPSFGIAAEDDVYSPTEEPSVYTITKFEIPIDEETGEQLPSAELVVDENEAEIPFPKTVKACLNGEEDYSDVPVFEWVQYEGIDNYAGFIPAFDSTKYLIAEDVLVLPYVVVTFVANREEPIGNDTEEVENNENELIGDNENNSHEDVIESEDSESDKIVIASFNCNVKSDDLNLIPRSTLNEYKNIAFYFDEVQFDLSVDDIYMPSDVSATIIVDEEKVEINLPIVSWEVVDEESLPENEKLLKAVFSDEYVISEESGDLYGIIIWQDHLVRSVNTVGGSPKAGSETGFQEGDIIKAYTDTSTTNRFQVDTSSGWQTVGTKLHYYLDNDGNRHVLYCLQHKVASVSGDYKITPLDKLNGYGNPPIQGLDDDVIRGLKVILQYGYPNSKINGVSDGDVSRQATQQVVRIWQYINDAGQQGSNGTYPGAFSLDLRGKKRADRLDILKNEAKNGTLKTRVGNNFRTIDRSYNDAAIDYMTQLLIKALTYEVMNPEIIVSPGTVSLKWDASKNLYTGTVTISNKTNHAYTYTTPDGFTITQSSDKTKLTITTTAEHAGESAVVNLASKDDRVPGNLFGFFPSGSHAYQTTMCILPNTVDVTAKFNIRVAGTPKGSIKIFKESTDPSNFTWLCKTYSLDGCTYDLIKESTGEVVDTLVVHKDTSGKYTAVSKLLDPGRYKIVETKSGEGFALNTADNCYVDVEAGVLEKEYRYKATTPDDLTLAVLGNEPYGDPLSLAIKKVDGNGNSIGIGNKKLKGAVFRVVYYDTIMDPNELSYKVINEDGYKNVEGAKVNRVWWLDSDENGLVGYDAEHYHLGNLFFYDQFGNIIAPLGTYTFQELEAPDGFIVDKETMYAITIQQLEDGSVIRTVSDNANLSGVGVVSATQVNEQATGQIQLSKCEIDTENGRISLEDAIEAGTPEQGAEFEVYEKVVTITVEEPEGDPDDENPLEPITIVTEEEVYICTLITDENGYAITPQMALHRDEDKKAYVGEYIVKQTKGTANTTFVDPFELTITITDAEAAEGITNKVVPQISEPLVNDHLYGTVRVYKRDAKTGELVGIPGFKFQFTPVNDIVVCGKVKYKAGEPVTIDGESEFVTNEDSYVDVLLPYGEYVITETFAVPPYIASTASYPVTVSKETLEAGDGRVVVEVENNSARGKIILSKTGDILTGTTSSTISTDIVVESGIVVKRPVIETKGLAGVTFELVVAEKIEDGNDVYEAGYSFGEKTTDENGELSFDLLPFGKYNLIEKAVPAGYIIDSTPIPVEIVYDENETASEIIENVTANNVLRQARINLEKQAEEMTVTEDADGSYIISYDPVVKSGFVFGLYNKEDIPIQNGDENAVIPANTLLAYAVSDENGAVKFTGKYPAGTYYLKEIKAVGKEMYELHEENIEFDTFTEDDTLAIKRINLGTVVNHYKKIPVVVNKTDITGAVALPGATLEILDSEGNVIYSGVTGENGELESIELIAGKYEIHEVFAPEGYVLTEENVSFEIVINEETGELEIVGETTMKDKPVECKIKIYKYGEMIVGIETVEEYGQSVIKPVIEESYLAGAVFEVTGPNDYNVQVTTTADGPVVLEHLALGEYKIKEISAPAGYILSSEEKTVVLTQDKPTDELVVETATFNNNLKTLNIYLKKLAEEQEIVTDDNGNITVEYIMRSAKGFVFGLYTNEEYPIAGKDGGTIAKDTLVATAESDEEGNVVFTGKYPQGTYYVKEIVAKDGYIMNEDKYAVDNSSDSQTNPEITVQFLDAIENYLLKRPVIVNKTDITGEQGLPGATLEIYNDHLEVIYRNVTNDAGELDEIELVPGKYAIHEVYAPEGYALSEGYVVFEIVVDEETGELKVEGSTTMKDELTYFEFYKTDESGKIKLSGAEFTMYNEDEEPVMVAVSDENGIVRFEGFGTGNYTIRETCAPEEYQLSGESITLHVTNEWLNSSNYNDGGELMTSFKNYETPKTGLETSNGTKVAAIAVSACVFAAILGAGLFIGLRKKKASEM